MTEYRYDLLDRVAEVWDNGKRTAEYTYYLDDSIKSLKNGESLYTEYAYDKDKNLTFLKTVLETEVLTENRYLYDGNGNRTQKEQTQGAVRGLTTYHYDCLNRLSAVEYPGRKEELFYDRAGNRTGWKSGIPTTGGTGLSLMKETVQSAGMNMMLPGTC